jgi:hypothetical protein
VCLLFFIFGVVKFLECILNVLVNCALYHLHEILSDYLQDFFFMGVFVNIIGFLVWFVFVLLASGTGYPFSSFPCESCIKLFLWKNDFHPFFFLPSLYLVLHRLVGGFSHLLSFPWFNFCFLVVGFLAWLVC